MQGEFSAIADGHRGAGEGFVRDGTLDHLERRLELGVAAFHGLERHGIFRQLETETQFHLDAGNSYREIPTHRNLAEERAGRRDLRDIADAERRQPRLRLRKSLDQIVAAKADGDHWLAGLEQLLCQLALLAQTIHVSLPN